MLEAGLQRFLTINNWRAKPLFIKVGANDGLTGDPCGDRLLRHDRWVGHLIEPIPYIYSKLQSIYSDSSRFVCHQLAISHEAGKAQIYYVSPEAEYSLQELPFYWDQLASFDRFHIERVLGQDIKPYILACEVPVITLRDLVVKWNIKNINFLHIDTEGHDLVVLKSLKISPKLKPEAILVEIKNLSVLDKSILADYLLGVGYPFLFYGGNDLIAFSNNIIGSCMIVYGWIVVIGSYLIGRKLH